MARARKDFNRIHDHGGVFVVFVGPRVDGRHVLAVDRGSMLGGLDVRLEMSSDNWSFLSALDASNIDVTSDSGAEITITDDAVGVAGFLRQHLSDAQFSATIHPTYKTQSRWVTLAHNKYEQPVAAVIVGEEETTSGPILLLPQVRDPGSLLVDLLSSFLPTISPPLFPHAEGAAWVTRSEYELPAVVRLKAQIEDTQREARARVVELEAEIEEQRRADGFMHDLLTRTRAPLVDAVRDALTELGFADVRDADSERARDLREDLQIHDRSPLLLVEIKGISNLPTEEDALQVVKYLAPRMRETGRLDLQGLSIINHQRNLPALDRENVTTFQPDVLTNALEQGFGLLTTWDLFRLVRRARIWGWDSSVLLPVLYRVGRIQPLPEHFEPLGRVVAVWPKADVLGVELEDGQAIRVGDSVAVEVQLTSTWGRLSLSRSTTFSTTR